MTDEEARALLVRYDAVVRAYDDEVRSGFPSLAVSREYAMTMLDLVHDLAAALRSTLDQRSTT